MDEILAKNFYQWTENWLVSIEAKIHQNTPLTGFPPSTNNTILDITHLIKTLQIRKKPYCNIHIIRHIHLTLTFHFIKLIITMAVK